VTWDEITSVRCRDVGYKGAIVRHYALFTDERKTFPRLTVRSDYDDVEELLSVVSAEIANRNVPIVVRKMGWPVPADRLPLPSDEPRSMW
jgi:ribulose 1,5-bisphosphate carboxylase large subunit-like protein